MWEPRAPLPSPQVSAAQCPGQRCPPGFSEGGHGPLGWAKVSFLMAEAGPLWGDQGACLGGEGSLVPGLQGSQGLCGSRRQGWADWGVCSGSPSSFTDTLWLEEALGPRGAAWISLGAGSLKSLLFSDRQQQTHKPACWGQRDRASFTLAASSLQTFQGSLGSPATLSS